MRWLFFISIALFFPGCTEGDSNTHEAGRAIYNYRCYFCHGYSGDAKTVAAASLKPAPRDFTAAPRLDITRIERALREGVPGTAMASFAGTLTPAEMRRVAAFVQSEFVLQRSRNTRYHTPENGWPGHERYAEAFAFATGELPVDAPWEILSEAQARGKRLFLGACVTCHDRGSAGEAVWEARAVSYPVNTAACLSCHNREGIDARLDDKADPHSVHDRAPRIAGLSALERRGEKLYQSNCAFCHAADGTGRNWIGSFLEPHPADFTAPSFRARVGAAQLRATIREGKAGSSMPAWRDVLAADEIEAVAAYVERAFGGISREREKRSQAFSDSAARQGSR